MRDLFSHLDHLIQIIPSVPLRKMTPEIWSTNSDLSHASVEDYIVCLGYPNKKVQKQIRKILS
jgi:hypothetical protein